MRERDGIDPNYATVISGGARVDVSRTRASSLALSKFSSDLSGCYVSSMLNECWIATLL
jgi:hypothetical protein